VAYILIHYLNIFFIELNAIKPELRFLIKIGALQIYIKLIYKQDIGLDNF
jgi:hypothetical protein